MSGQRTRISIPPIPDSVGNKRVDRLLQKARKASFSRVLVEEPKHIKLPIPASIILTTSGDLYLFVFTVRIGEGVDNPVIAKTAEMFGPINPEEDIRKQISLRYGWADFQDHEELNGIYERLDSLDVSFYYLLDLRDLLSSEKTVVEAVRRQDLGELTKLCPPWEMA